MYFKKTFFNLLILANLGNHSARASDDKDKIPLIKAVLLKEYGHAQALLAQGANPNINHLDKPLIHYSIKAGDLDIALLLVNAGADFSGKVDGDQDAFTYVATHCNTPVTGKNTRPDFDLLHAMLERGYNLQQNINNKNLHNNAWYMAIKNNHTNLIGQFLGWGGRSVTNPYPLLKCAVTDTVFTFQDGTSLTPLLLSIKLLPEHAEQLGHGTLGSLLEYGSFNTNKKTLSSGKKQNSPLSYALEINPDSYHIPLGSTINRLINSGANLSEAIELFLKNGGSANHLVVDQRFGRWTLLGLAVFYNSVDAVRILLKENANINLRTDSSAYITPNIKGSHTPLYFAFKIGNTEIAELLLKNGATVD